MKLPHNVIVKSPGLLPMLYTVSELANELTIPDRTLRDWLDAGAPHQRDSTDHIWIHGSLFAQWVKQQRRPKRQRKLDNESAFCLRCNEAVKLTNPQQHHIKGKLYIIKGVCPQCGSIINRGTRNAKNDSSRELPTYTKIS